MLQKKNVLTIFGYSFLCAVTVYVCASCMFPTNDDVNNMQKSNQTFNQGLHDAGNKLMTEQHSAMTPELAEAFAVMQGQYNELSAQLKAKAGEAKAVGVDISGLGSFGGPNDWFTVIAGLFGFGGIAGWISNLLKPSRATKRIDELETRLAVAAPAGEAFPGDKAT